MLQNQGLQQPQQQGLGSPQGQEQGQEVQNPYFTPSAAMEAYNANLTGARNNELQQVAKQGLAQGLVQGAQAGYAKGADDGVKAGLVHPQVSPQQILADDIASGKIDQPTLQKLVAAGKVSPQVAQEAIQLVANAQQPQQPQQGLV